MLPIEACSPIVTIVSMFNSSKDREYILRGNQYKFSPPRIVYQYEIQIFTKSGGVAIIDDNEYPIRRGDIRFLRPGQKVFTKLHFECYYCRFIFDTNFDKDTFQPFYRNPCLDSIPEFLSAYTPDDYYNIFEYMINKYVSHGMHAPILLKAKVLELLGLLYEDSCRQNSAGPIDRNIADAVTEAMRYIREKYAEPITLSDISKHVNLSPTYFHRVFKKVVTMKRLEYITKIRLEQAKKYLLTTPMPVAEIAERCGFDSTAYFTTLFHKHLGQTPGTYRKHMRLEI